MQQKLSISKLSQKVLSVVVMNYKCTYTKLVGYTLLILNHIKTFDRCALFNRYLIASNYVENRIINDAFFTCFLTGKTM